MTVREVAVMFIVYAIIISLGFLWSNGMTDLFHFVFPDQDKSWSGIGLKFATLIIYTGVCILITLAFFEKESHVKIGKYILNS